MPNEAETTPSNYNPLDAHIASILARRMGQNGLLANEIKAKLSPLAKARLYHVLNDMMQEISNEQRKRKQGRFF